MKTRAEKKQESLQSIVHSGAARIRKEGLAGSVISEVMKDAGLTHGTFYSHFNNKNELLIASLQQALVENRPRWITNRKKEPWPRRLMRLAQRYLTAAHRDDLQCSCALAALMSETGRSNIEFREAYEAELFKSLEAICGNVPCDAGLNPAMFEEAVMFMALCMGGINLSRAVKSPNVSDQILEICRKAAERIATGDNSTAMASSLPSGAESDETDFFSSIGQFPIQTYEKLRYSDTDRQGHINNAVFSTMLETGRVEILYNPDHPLADRNCAFVIANQTLNYLAEITWPGRVMIGTRVAEIGRSSITFEQALFQNDRPCATAATVSVQMNETTRRSAPLSSDTRDYLNRLTLEKAPR